MSAAAPIPASRSLAAVLRGLTIGQEVRLVVGTALADDAGLPNSAAYMNVEIEGQALVVPKLANAGLGGAGSGYPVYILVTAGAALAIGTVSTTPAMTVPSLVVTGNLSCGSFNVGPYDMRGSSTSDLYIRNVYHTGSLIQQ